MAENISTHELSAAEKHYIRHLKTVSDYQKRNPEKMREKNKSYMKKMKNDDPQKYQEFLEKRRKYYSEVVKPKNGKKHEIQKLSLE